MEIGERELEERREQEGGREQECESKRERTGWKRKEKERVQRNEEPLGRKSMEGGRRDRRREVEEDRR